MPLKANGILKFHGESEHSNLSQFFFFNLLKIFIYFFICWGTFQKSFTVLTSSMAKDVPV